MFPHPPEDDPYPQRFVGMPSPFFFFFRFSLFFLGLLYVASGSDRRAERSVYYSKAVLVSWV